MRAPAGRWTAVEEGAGLRWARACRRWRHGWRLARRWSRRWRWALVIAEEEGVVVVIATELPVVVGRRMVEGAAELGVIRAQPTMVVGALAPREGPPTTAGCWMVCETQEEVVVSCLLAVVGLC